MHAEPSAAAEILPDTSAGRRSPARALPLLILLAGLGGLFFGVTGPLLSAFVPPLVRDTLGEHRTAIGVVMAIDNVLLLLLVPWAGAASDRAIAAGRGRMPIVASGLVLSAVGMATLPFSGGYGITGIVSAMVVLYTGINLVRSPYQALLADLVPSRYRSLATGSLTFQMCVGAIVFLMLGRALGMAPAFLVAAGTVLAIAAAFGLFVHEPPVTDPHPPEATIRSLLDAVYSVARGAVPGMRAVFVAGVLLQLTFQTFSTWYALHATERFGIRPEDATLGFIAWAVGGVIGALPAGAIGARFGRRNTMIAGFALMSAALFAVDRVATPSQAALWLGLTSICWTLPSVNAYPLFIEPIPRDRRGTLSALFLLAMVLGGAIGDPLNGALFDLLSGYRPMFAMMAGYTALALVAVVFVPGGTGEAKEEGLGLEAGGLGPDPPTRR